MAPGLGVLPTITEAAVSEANIGLALGNRCISIGHKTQVTNSTLLALSEAGVTYISTRSVGYNHVDVNYAESVGIAVETVAYSPDSVADYTLMLMLMAVRHAKSVIRRAEVHDYRLNDVLGKELRDLTIGVIGTGRIGAAVMDRLRGFGCRMLAHDKRPRTGAEYLPLDELLQQSDVVTLHTPLTAETHHLLDTGTIEQMVCISGQRRVEGHDVAPPQQLAKPNVVGRGLGTTVMGQDSAAKALQPVDDRGADATCPDHPNGQVA